MPDSDKSRSGRSAGKKSAAKSTATSPKKAIMSESDPGSVFDLDRLRRLVELMKEHGLAEVDLRESEQQIRISRGAIAAPAAFAQPAPVAAMPPPAQPAAAGPAKSAAADGPSVVVIKSPMVGTFYSRANPKAEPFVKVGDRVDPSTVICIVEAMKVFNEIPAEVRGKVVAILASDGEAVEFDKPLFKVDTSG